MANLGFVVATYHGPIVERMERHARKVAEEHAATVDETFRVSGAYDTVLPADRLARREDIDAVVVLGAIITGETDHDQVIGQAAATGLQAVARKRDTPVTFGITGPGMSAEEAAERVEYGGEAVKAALSLIDELAD